MHISEETADEQLRALFEYYDFEPNDLPTTVRSVVDGAARTVKRAITTGRIEIVFEDNTCVVKQHLSNPCDGTPNPLVYEEITGATKMAIKDDMDAHVKAFAFLAAMAKENIAVIKKLRGKDIGLAEALAALFLQI